MTTCTCYCHLEKKIQKTLLIIDTDIKKTVLGDWDQICWFDMLFTVCFFVHVSHCMSSVSLSVGGLLLKLQSSQQKVTGICVRRGKWTVSAQHAAPALLCFQLCNRNIITWLLLAAGWDGSLSPPKSSSACRLLSACPRVRSEDEGEFPRDSHKRPARHTVARGCLRYTTFFTFNPWDNIFESNVSSPCFPPGCQTDSVLQPNTESVLQLHWGTKGFYVQVKIKLDSGHPLE